MTPSTGSRVGLSKAPPTRDSPRATFDQVKSVRTVARQTDPWESNPCISHVLIHVPKLRNSHSAVQLTEIKAAWEVLVFHK